MRKGIFTAILLTGTLGASVGFSSLNTNQNKSQKNNKLDACVLEDLATAGLGDVKYSILSETQFQNVNGDGWVLMAGQDKTTLGIGPSEPSVFDYLDAANSSTTNLPDGRGLFLRGKNNSRSDGNENPDGDSLLGLFQVQKNNRLEQFETVRAQSASYYFEYLPADGSWSGFLRPGIETGGVELALRMKLTGTETRPSNLTVNTFVKVKQNCLDDVATTHRNSNSTRLDAAEAFIAINTCDTCLTMPESDLTELRAKHVCFETEIDAFEADNRAWSVSCQARTIGHSKRVLMEIGAGSRTTAETDFLNHIDNQYPFYNVIETTFSE